MPNSAPRKINVTAYVTLSILGVITAFGFKFCTVDTHEFTNVSPRRLISQDLSRHEGFRVEDLNGTLSATDKAWLKEMIRIQMQFHGLHTPQQDPLVVKVSLWESGADFKNYQARISKTSTSSKGFYSVSRRELVVNKSKLDYRKTLAHEAQHLIIRRAVFAPPNG